MFPALRAWIQQSAFFRWTLVGLLFLIAALYYFDRPAFKSVFPHLRRDLGFTDVGLASPLSAGLHLVGTIPGDCRVGLQFFLPALSRPG